MRGTRITVVVFERTRTTLRSARPRATQGAMSPTPEERPATKPFFRHLLVDLAIACVCSAAILALLGARSPKLTERENARVEGIRRVARSEQQAAQAPARLGELQRSVLDTELASSELGFRAMVELEDGLQATWEWVSGDPELAGERGPGDRADGSERHERASP